MGFISDDLTPKRPATAVVPFTDFPSDGGNAEKPEVATAQATEAQPEKNTAIDTTGITGNNGKESFVQQPTEDVTKVEPNQGIKIDWSRPYSEIELNPILQQMKPYDIMRDYQKNGDGNWATFMPWLSTLGDADKTVAANEAMKKKAERQAKMEQWSNFFMHLGNFFGTTQGAPSQKIESAQELTERQRKLREGTDALRQKGYDQMMVNIWKDRQNKQAQMQAEAAAKANEALAAYRASQKNQTDALTPVKVEEVTQSARQHSTGADLNVSKKETEDALRGKKGKLLDAQTNNANAGAADHNASVNVKGAQVRHINSQTEGQNQRNANQKEADDFNTRYVNDPKFKKHVNEWATHNGMSIGGNDGRGGTWANEKNRQQASAYARAKMAKEGKKRTVRPYGGKPAKRTSSTKVDYSKYIRK
mgnify:CR=1 FL=1|nr:MAG TPA: hypothetical protein [Caudoviricetes sp.]